MLLLGITGPIGHGKTTLANMLADLEPATLQTETSIVISEVVTLLNQHWSQTKPSRDNIPAVNAWLAHLPPILESVVHKSFSAEQFTLTEAKIQAEPDHYEKLWEYLVDCQQEENLATQAITPETKPRYRAILQWLGGYGVTKLDAGIWFDELLHRAKAAETKCELFIIGGVRFLSDAESVRQANGKIIEIVRPHTLQIDVADPTERERAKISSDVRILNDGSLADLTAKATSLLADLKTGRPQASY